MVMDWRTVKVHDASMEIRRRAWFTAALAAVIMTTMLPVLAQESNTPPFTLEKRSAAKHIDRYGDLPLGAVIGTDERYNNNSLFQGPRGWDYWNLLEKPMVYQDPNLWPDKRPTYFIGQLQMPPGSDLTIRGRFPTAFLT